MAQTHVKTRKKVALAGSKIRVKRANLPQIVVDSREQRPYWQGKDALKTALNVGDYTTIALMNRFHIERKSLPDLYGTITRGHVRFRWEILRAQKAGVKLVVMVEGSPKDFFDLNFARGDKLKIKGEQLKKIITTMKKKYALEFVWCSSRVTAKKEVLKRLIKEEKKLPK
jgi:DNA excision repair protein ERCC-4